VVALVVLADVLLSLDDELVAELLELSVEVIDKLSVEVAEEEPVLLSVDVTEPVEVTEPVTTPVAVPVAPEIPKLGEKLMLVGSVSSMISMVYTWELTSPAGGIWRVAVPSEAGIPEASTAPESGVTGSCCSLMVTVPDEGFVHVIVRGCPAVTSRVPAPSGILMALFCADATAAQMAATTVYAKRMLEDARESGEGSREGDARVVYRMQKRGLGGDEVD